MSNNNWETQPRETNGKFTFRIRKGLFQRAVEEVSKQQKDKKDEIIRTSRGGSYGKLRKIIAGNNSYEIHHMPAASVSPLSYWKGPCIIMFTEDHKLTSSYKNSKASKKYRVWQAKLISEGKFLEAQFMDIKNIKRKFGNRYDKSIIEKLDYEVELAKEGIIHG